MEVFKDIIGYEGFYQISNYGRVKSLTRPHNLGGIRKERILKPGIDGGGYFFVDLRKNGIRKEYLISRLVLSHFFPIENSDKLEANHLDGNKNNNFLSNLEWCTRSQNQIHARKIGLNKNKEETHINAKLTKKDILEIKLLLKTGISQQNIALQYKVAQSHISRINTNLSWKDVQIE